jgi:phosphoglucosamine mutase
VIALDTANGALYSIAIDVFHALGAKLVFSDSLPNGTNINDHCGSVYPNVLASVLKKYSIIKAGFAFDGDGDRIVAINSNGDIKDGDDILSLLLQLPIYKNQKGIVGTIISNGGLEQYIKNIGKEFIRVSVGDKYVAKALKTTQFILGGEPSGHVILNDHLPISDGLFIAIKVLHSIMLNNNWEMKTFDKMIQINATIPIKYKADLSKSPFIDSIKKQEARIPLGKIIVRYSGTENVLRILVEDLDTILAQSVTNDLITEISTLFTQSLINDVNNATYHTNTGESPYELSA